MSAFNSAFSLSAIAKNRLRMEWISVNVSELHRLDNGTILGVLEDDDTYIRVIVQRIGCVIKNGTVCVIIQAK